MIWKLQDIFWAPYFQFDGFKGKIEHCYVVQPEDMEMERYGLEPIGARYPISPLSVCTLILLVNKPDQVKDVKNIQTWGKNAINFPLYSFCRSHCSLSEH